MQTSLMVMATTFPVQPQQSSRLSAAAPVVSGPSVTSWRRRGHSASRCLRVQRNSALHSAQARSDHLDTVDGDGLNPCGFHPSIWGDFFLHHSNPADFDEQQTLDLVRCFNTEVKMRDDGYVPKSVEEHLQREQKMTLHVASTIHSYMKEHNVSIEIAREKVVELKEETWKDFNAEWLNPENSQPKQILNRIFNLARTMEFFYNKDDNFTNCHNIKDKIHSLFVEPFTIM
ncbi:hypothetical protein PR202_ga00691 [Eleusine coracana subsp. coracana]|uniref:Terpene synthase metal-binding domain-containing protein n=1 Tax=Eleusine coracana subsp. coracana TaxID=191504 RepID=A0AAV5BG87_ELECO|nr:hypothetical protein PR202_ga00691 [Eleusine coracana subsp. coracana]